MIENWVASIESLRNTSFSLNQKVKCGVWLAAYCSPSFNTVVSELELLIWKVVVGEHGKVAATRDFSRSCLDPNDFTVLHCIVKGHASFSPPSLWLRLCSRFTLLATYTYFDPKDFSPYPIDSVKGHASLSPLGQQKAKKKNKTKKKHRFTK
ncbi:hypothetical protein TNCV_733731 [Trichonephila clavipes]|nr:hypothetical protein TNCV_733731 [Trichonephila clavipes]